MIAVRAEARNMQDRCGYVQISNNKAALSIHRSY